MVAFAPAGKMRHTVGIAAAESSAWIADFPIEFAAKLTTAGLKHGLTGIVAPEVRGLISPVHDPLLKRMPVADIKHTFGNLH